MSDTKCGRCGHRLNQHDENGTEIMPCDWTSPDYWANVRGVHCHCFAFYAEGSSCPVFGPAIKNRKGVVMKSIVALLLLSSSVYAGGNSISLKIGGNKTLTEVKAVGTASDGEAGALIGGEFVHRIGRFGIGAEVSSLSRSSSESRSLIPGAAAKLSGDTILALVNSRAYLTDGLFIGGGFGLAHSHQRAELTPSSGFLWADTMTSETRVILDQTKDALALAAKIGYEISVGKYGIAGLEVGYVHVAPVSYNTTLGDFKGPQSAVTLAASFGVKF